MNPSDFDDLIGQIGAWTFGHPPGGRDPARMGPLLEVLGQVWARNPDLRLGQLLCGLNTMDRPERDLFYLEDDVLLELLQRQQDGPP
ncbi:DUF1040 family protein [Holophaga foetida]|uniref:DUF1040 family protein n=1 Tax=Holophaga foetida TaxID=35839 RepID=UPI0002471C2C|nr:DUF1040 family protein [Holophaga foetida]